MPDRRLKQGEVLGADGRRGKKRSFCRALRRSVWVVGRSLLSVGRTPRPPRSPCLLPHAAHPPLFIGWPAAATPATAVQYHKTSPLTGEPLCNFLVTENEEFQEMVHDYVLAQSKLKAETDPCKMLLRTAGVKRLAAEGPGRGQCDQPSSFPRSRHITPPPLLR